MPITLYVYLYQSTRPIASANFNYKHVLRDLCAPWSLVRDSSAVRRLFVRLVGAMGRQSALHKENSGFVAPTLGRHISTFRSYRILFSIRNPYINRLTNYFSIHS